MPGELPHVCLHARTSPKAGKNLPPSPLLPSPLCTGSREKKQPTSTTVSETHHPPAWALDQKGKTKNAVLIPAVYSLWPWKATISKCEQEIPSQALSGGALGNSAEAEVHGYRELSETMPDLWLPELRKPLHTLRKQRKRRRTGSRHEPPPSSVSKHEKYNQIWGTRNRLFLSGSQKNPFYIICSNYTCLKK